MQFTTAIAVALAAMTTTFAAPTPAPLDAGIEARAASWTLQNFERVCGGDSCSFSYSISDGATVTFCNYRSAGPHASYSEKCGKYAVTSAWSDQFGANAGFSTMSVVKNQQIIYPSYTDAELKNGKAVASKSYTPVAI